MIGLACLVRIWGICWFSGFGFLYGWYNIGFVVWVCRGVSLWVGLVGGRCGIAVGNGAVSLFADWCFCCVCVLGVGCLSLIWWDCVSGWIWVV